METGGESNRSRSQSARASAGGCAGLWRLRHARAGLSFGLWPAVTRRSIRSPATVRTRVERAPPLNLDSKPWNLNLKRAPSLHP